MENIGICTTCFNNPECINLFSDGRTKLFCESFEIETYLPYRTYEKEKHRNIQEIDNPISGICNNCSIVTNCSLADTNTIKHYCLEHQIN